MLSSNKTIDLSKLLLDLLSINCAFGLANLIVFDHFWVDGWAYPSLFLVINLASLLVYRLTEQRLLNPSLHTKRIFQYSFKFSMLVFTLTFVYWLIINSQKYYAVHLALLLIFLILFVFINKILWNKFLKIFANRVYRRKKLLLVGNLDEISKIESKINQNKWLNFRIKSFDFKDISIEDFQLYINQENVQMVFIDCATHFESISKLLSEKSKWTLTKFYGFNLPKGELKGKNKKIIGDYIFYHLN